MQISPFILWFLVLVSVSLTILEGWVVVMHLKHEERVMLWVQSVRQGETHVIRKKLACNHTQEAKN